MRFEDDLFFSNEPLSESNTSMTLDILGGEHATRGEGLAQKKMLEGKITLNSQSYSLSALSPAPGSAEQMSWAVDHTKWDFYLVTLPFTLHKAPSNTSYQEVTFFVTLNTPGATAFDLFPRDITTHANRNTAYTIFPDMHIQEVLAPSSQEERYIRFETLHPRITAFGEGEDRFYWIYEGSEPEREVLPETKHALVVVRVPKGTKMVEGTISYEVIIAKKILSRWRNTNCSVDPYPLRWEFGAATPSFFPPRVQSNRQPKNGLNLFYSYAVEDTLLQKKLEKHLATLRRQDMINELRAHAVGPGLPQERVGSYLEQAQIILLLISPDFLSSDDLYERQLRPALTMQEEGRARVVPVLLRETGGWKQTPFGTLVVLPRNKKPVVVWSNQDAAFAQIADEVREIVNQLKNNGG